MSKLKPTKYYTSFLLQFISNDRFLYRFADREEAIHPSAELMDRVRNCMIYLICSRPIITINPETFKYNSTYCEFEISYRLNDKININKVKTPIGLIQDYGGKIEVSKYPHTSIHFYDKENNLIEDLLIANLIHILEGVSKDVSDHEVLYIGKGTADCAVDRLDGHSTLEKIISDILKSEPNKEVVILLYNLQMKKNALTSPIIGDNAEVRGDKAKLHFEKILNFKPGIDEQTKIAEALLINYFSTTKYNSHFSNKLSIDAKVFKNVRDADFDALVAELNNEDIGGLNIFSKTVPSNYFHNALFDIRKSEGRVTLFDMKR
jgi:hypothetical protein